MAQFPRETNIAVKEGLDALFGDGQTSQLFATPVATQEDLIARGLVDETGTATDRGVLFTQLQDAGLFDERGAMTPKAHAYAMDYSEVVGGGERTLDAYKARMDDGIDNPDVSWDETLGAVGDYAWDMAAGFGNMVKLVNKEVFSFGESAADIKKREAETSAAMTAGVEGAMKANFELAGMMGVANAHLVNEWFYDAPEQEREKRVWLARQQRDKISYDNQAAKIGETMESFMPVDGVTEQMAADKQTLGKPLFDQTVKQADAAGNMVTIDAVLPAGLATKAATTGSKISRIALTAERHLGQRAAAATRLAAKELEHATAVRIGGAAEKTAAQAERAAGSLTARFEATGDQVLGRGARRASEIAAEHGAIAARSTAAAAEAAAEVERLSAQASKLTTLIPEKAAQKFLQTVELGRKIKAMPATALGATLERVGNGLTRGDAAITGFLKERGLDQLYTGAVGAAGMLGLAGNPVLGVVGAGAGVLKTGKLIESYGKLLRYVGKEMTQARGQIPFWQRVAAHTAPGSLNRGLAHTFGVFELGGATSDVIRRTGRGIMAAAPADLAFEWLADDGDVSANTFKQSFAESLVIGGSFAAGGGAFMGTKRRMRELSLGDELNFRKGLVDPIQKSLFEAIPTGLRRSVATYSVANPTLNFNFTKGGGSHYDINTNAATIDVTSTNPLKPLIAHEVLHHTIIKNSMEGGIAALFLGDTQGDGNGNYVTGGLLRGKDGSLDKNFAEFVETYNRRMDNELQNASPDRKISTDEFKKNRPSLDSMAVEYFIEQHADQYSDMAESGELGALAARGAARRWMGSALESILPKSAVLKDLHHKMGGAMDANGANVVGNGLLADGIRQLPAAQRMFRDMNRRSSGRVPGQFAPLGSEAGDHGGAAITLDPTNAIDLELMHPLIEYDAAGKPVGLSKATDLLRSSAGITVMEKLRENKAAGIRHAPGEMHLDDNGELQGQWLSPDVLRDVAAKHKLNPEQVQVLKSVNAAIKTGDGNRMVVINFPATEKTRSGKVVYATKKATIRDIVPVALTITKDHNLLIGLMSVTKLHENIVKRAQSKRGKKLYGGNTDLILHDVRAMMDFHKQGTDSIEHFKSKYGAVEADERKKFINTIFGLMNKSEQAVLNPMLLEDGVKSSDNVYRTYRVDRVSKAVPMDPIQNPPMPFSYEAASAVKMPGMPSMPGMPDGARMLPEGFTPRPTTWKDLADIPEITLKDLVGKDVFPTLADKTSAGKIYYGIDSSEIIVPVETFGGPDWPRIQDDTIWANSGKGVISMKQKRKGMVMLVHAMMDDSHKSNASTTDAILKTNAAYARDKKINKTGIARINKMIRDEIGTDFPGIDNPSATAFLAGKSFVQRSRVADIFSSKFAQSHGAANTPRILNELLSKEHAGTNWGDALIALEIDPDGAFIDLNGDGHMDHPAYNYGVKGKVLGKLSRPISYKLIYEDFIEKRRSAGADVAGDRRSFELSKPVQRITQEIADKVPSTPYKHLKSPKHAQLLDHAVNDRWQTTGGTISDGALSPAFVVDAINASPAKLSLDNYTPAELGKKVKSGEMSLYRLEDSEVIFGIKNGDPASAYGKKPEEFGFSPDEKTLTLVINNEIAAPGMADVIMNKALQEGVTALDAFSVKSDKFPSGMLPTIYERFGFEPRGEIPFDPKYKTKRELLDLKHYWRSLGWKEKDGLPPVVLMKWVGNESDRVNPLGQVAAKGQKGLQAGDSSGGLFSNAEEDLGRVDRGRSSSPQGGRQQGDGTRVGGNKGSDARPLRVSSGTTAAITELAGLTPIERDNLGLRYLPEPLEIHATASGAAVKTKLKHSKSPVSFEAGNGRVESPGLRYLPEPVYHGTPHEVDQFSTDKIGTGEGAQAYGWGLYFAESQAVAADYQKGLSGYIAVDGNVIHKNNRTVGTTGDSGLDDLLVGNMGDIDAAIKDAQDGLEDYSPKLEALRNRVNVSTNGNLYTVKLKPEAHEFLDWDKPLSEQSEKIQNIARTTDISAAKGATKGALLAWREGRDVGMVPNGQTLHRAIADYGENSEAASKLLAAAGIKGIRYLDGNSRNATSWKITPPEGTFSGKWMVKSNDYNSKGLHFDTEAEAKAALAEKLAEASYNYVVFDEKDIEITHANGKPKQP